MVILGDVYAHSPFWEKECVPLTCYSLVDYIVDSILFLLNDGTITRIPGVYTHKATAIDLPLVTPDMQ